MDTSAIPLPVLAAQATKRYSERVFEEDGLAGYRAPEGIVQVARYDGHEEPYDADGAQHLLTFGWTFDAPTSWLLWFDLTPVDTGWLVLVENPEEGYEARAMLRLTGDLSPRGLAATMHALADVMNEHLPEDERAPIAWPTEIKEQRPDLPREAALQFVRALSPFPDPHGRAPAEFDGLDGSDSTPAQIEAAYAAYLGRILPAE